MHARPALHPPGRYRKAAHAPRQTAPRDALIHAARAQVRTDVGFSRGIEWSRARLDIASAAVSPSHEPWRWGGR